METVPAGVSHTRHWLAVGCIVAALLGVAGLAGRVSATVVIAKDFAALCDEADLVFVGTVTGVASRWSDPATQSVETLVTFGDLTWLRGTVQTTVTLRFGGGEMDGLREPDRVAHRGDDADAGAGGAAGHRRPRRRRGPRRPIGAERPWRTALR